MILIERSYVIFFLAQRAGHRAVLEFLITGGLVQISFHSAFRASHEHQTK
jgi:hypothetical protein